MWKDELGAGEAADTADRPDAMGGDIGLTSRKPDPWCPFAGESRGIVPARVGRGGGTPFVGVMLDGRVADEGPAESLLRLGEAVDDLV